MMNLAVSAASGDQAGACQLATHGRGPSDEQEVRVLATFLYRRAESAVSDAPWAPGASRRMQKLDGTWPGHPAI